MKLKSILKEILSDGVVYHGTNNKFTSFDDSKPIFFSDDIKVAKSYGDTILKAKLNLDNPLEVDFERNSTIHFIDKWYVPSDFAALIKGISEDIDKYGGLHMIEDSIQEEIGYLGWRDNGAGMDGIIMKNIRDSYGDMFAGNIVANNYVVFDKNRINLV